MLLEGTSAVWGRDYIGKTNSGLFFRLITESDNASSARLTLSAKQVYKILLNGQTVGYGPERTAHGYSKVDRMTLNYKAGKNVLVVEILQPFVENYYIVKENAYFCAELETCGRKYTTKDFSCCLQSDRVENSQRYSPQRTFAESYDMSLSRTAFYSGEDVFPEVETAEVKKDILIERDCTYPLFANYDSIKLIKTGTFSVDHDKRIREEDKFLINEVFERFPDRENLTDTVSSFAFGETDSLQRRFYFYELDREVSGFINIALEAESDSEIYVLFDEILGGGDIKINRLACANIIKWKLKKGKYILSSFEPYSLKYLKICLLKGELSCISPSITLYENSAAYKLKFNIKNEKLDLILRAAQNTYAQNSVDMLIDCPSRERAGWINDCWLSRYSPYLFEGGGAPFESLLRAYALAPDGLGIPKGMLPMCYPSDFYTKRFICACAMWFVLCLNEYRRTNGKNEIVELSIPKIKENLDYFAGFENEYELLEDIEGWVFVEWSDAGLPSHTEGVNFPTNMLYHKMLIAASEILEDKTLLQKAARIKENIISLSYNGSFFEDNAVREDGRLTLKGHLTEVCQYYAFECGVASKLDFPALYEAMKNDFAYKSESIHKGVGRANIIIGMCLREKLLLTMGEADKVLKEIEEIYYPMAKETETLWEHIDERASCNHGIASFAGVCIVSALTGFVGVKDGVAYFREQEYFIDCDFKIPYENDFIEVAVKDGKIRIKDGKIKHLFTK